MYEGKNLNLEKEKERLNLRIKQAEDVVETF